MGYSIINALDSLRPGASWALRGDELEWLDTNLTQPTESEIQTEITRLQAEYDALEYARLRQADYPSLQDCLHAILDDDLEALQVKRQEVKNRYPKS
jgi:hypothetical protein